MSKNWGGVKLWYQRNHVFLPGANVYVKPRGWKHRVETVGAFLEKVGQSSPKLLVLKHWLDASICKRVVERRDGYPKGNHLFAEMKWSQGANPFSTDPHLAGSILGTLQSIGRLVGSNGTKYVLSPRKDVLPPLFHLSYHIWDFLCCWPFFIILTSMSLTLCSWLQYNQLSSSVPD